MQFHRLPITSYFLSLVHYFNHQNYHLLKGTRLCPFLVTGNGHGLATYPKGDQFSGHNLDMIPDSNLRRAPKLLNLVLGVNVEVWVNANVFVGL